MSTSAVASTPPPKPAPVAVNNRKKPEDPMYIAELDSPSVPSPLRKGRSKIPLTNITPIRREEFAPVNEEISQLFQKNCPVPGSTNLRLSDMVQPTPQPPASPQPESGPSTPNVDAQHNPYYSPTGRSPLQEHPINTLRPPSISESRLDTIMRLEISTFAHAAKAHAIAQRYLLLALEHFESHPAECETYFLNTESLLYKCFNYFNDNNPASRAEQWLQVMCKVDMARTIGDFDFTTFWVSTALKDLDHYLAQSETTEDIDDCKKLYQSISSICPNGPEVPPKLTNLRLNLTQRIEECDKLIQQLKSGAKPLSIQQPPKTQPERKITIRRIFACAMTLVIAGLAIVQRKRILNTLQNTLSQSSHLTPLVSLFNRTISSYRK